MGSGVGWRNSCPKKKICLSKRLLGGRRPGRLRPESRIG
jgi:hypothetical protein